MPANCSDETYLVQFDDFAQLLFMAIDKCVCICDSSCRSSRAKCILREKLWSSFHRLRLKELAGIWKVFIQKIKIKRLDSLIEQHVNVNLFESILKSRTPVTQSGARCSASQLPTLSSDEENIIRYAAGYVSMKLLKKYEEQSSSVAVEYVECLSSMAVNGEESSLQEYTLEWTRKVSRGGLFEVNDETFRLFREIEIKMQWHLMEVLSRSVAIPGQNQLIIDTVASDDDVPFLLALLSCDIREEDHAIILLKNTLNLWLTIRGFTVAGTWVEQHKTENKDKYW